jgi:hypothetical protein
MEIPVMQPAVTVTVWVPEMAVFCVEVAVIVTVPTASALTFPPVVIEAAVVSPVKGVRDQTTDGLEVVLPSLLTPVAYICT